VTMDRPWEDVLAAVASLCRTGAVPPSRITVKHGDLSLDISWPEPAAVPVDGVPVVPVVPVAEPAGTVVAAETVGTFYRAAGPGEPPYALPGDQVRAGAQVGVLEAMKVLSPVCAPADGRVVEFLADDGASVEYGQPLLLLATEAG
jgi:acetyl-CoA carboxylase biotin carboxyl carrier protein